MVDGPDSDGPGSDERGMRSAFARLRPGRFATREDLEQLRARMAELEDEVQESRRLNRRLAEITDLVQELLLPADQRQNEDELRQRLEAYASQL